MNEGSSRFFVLNLGKCTKVYGRIVYGFGRLVVNEACRYLLVITRREVNNELAVQQRGAPRAPVPPSR